MSLSARFARQLAHPSGLAGRVLGAAMDLANRRPTRLAIERLAPRVGESVLDVGCGTGAALEHVRYLTGTMVTGVDPSPVMARRAAARLIGLGQIFRAGMASLPFEDGSFDAVLALNVLYFCDAEGAMLREVHRVLRPGGRLVAYVTHRETMTRWPFARAGHHRLFDDDDLVAALSAGGFASDLICVQQCRVTRSVTGLLGWAGRANCE